jgi:hypothetical protein
MDKQKLGQLQNKVGNSLGKQISELDQITRELTEDLKTSTGAEREKNQALLSAAQNLLQQLKDAQVNIGKLIDKNR